MVLLLQGDDPSYLLVQGMDDDRLLVGTPGQMITVSRNPVESRWLGGYLVAWPQASSWPPFIGRDDDGLAVSKVMEMATRVDVPYHGSQVFDVNFENWLKSFQKRNGLAADGIVGRKTLLYLMTASITKPQLLQAWD